MNKPSAHDLLGSFEKSYAKKWTDESILWRNRNIYSVIADVINLQEGDRHLDIGSGNGLLLHAMTTRLGDKNARIFGVERDATLLNASFQVLVNDTYGTENFLAMHLGRSANEQDDIVSYDYHLADDFDDQIAQLAEMEYRVFLMQDDVRSAAVLTRILGQPKLQSVSFTFPGVGTNASLESPYSIPRTESEVQEFTNNVMRQRTKLYMNQTREAAYRIATKHVEPGGSFVCAERAMRSADVDHHQYMHIVTDTRLAEMKRYGDYWIPEAIHVSSNISDLDSPINWFVSTEHGEHPVARDTIRENGGDIVVAILKMRRNNLIYNDVQN